MKHSRIAVFKSYKDMFDMTSSCRESQYRCLHVFWVFFLLSSFHQPHPILSNFFFHLSLLLVFFLFFIFYSYFFISHFLLSLSCFKIPCLSLFFYLFPLVPLLLAFFLYVFTLFLSLNSFVLFPSSSPILNSLN